MTKEEAIQLLRAMQKPGAWDPQITEDAFTALDMAINVLKEQQISEAIKQAKQNQPIDMFPLLSEEEKQQNRWYAQGVVDALKVVREERAISGDDALDILDQFEDAVENGEGGFFYSKAREMMCDLIDSNLIGDLIANGVVHHEDIKELPSEPYVSFGVYQQVAWERDVATEQLRELGYSLGEKIITCKNCEHWGKKQGRRYCFEMYFDQDDPNFYCGYAKEKEEVDECQDCEAYECYKNGIHAKCPKTGFFDDCAKAEREHNEAGGWE